MEGTRTCLVTSRLLKQGFDFTRLQNTFRKFLQQDPIALRKYQVSRKTCMFNVFLVHCLFFLLCVVTSLPVKCHHTHIHVHATSVQVLSCCVVFCLHVVCSLNVHHPCHAYHYSWSSLYITCTTVPVYVHVTFVHTYHATCPLCCPHVICLFQPYSTYSTGQRQGIMQTRCARVCLRRQNAFISCSCVCMYEK